MLRNRLDTLEHVMINVWLVMLRGLAHLRCAEQTPQITPPKEDSLAGFSALFLPP